MEELFVKDRLSMDDYHNKLISKMLTAKQALLNSINVTEEQYVKLTTTEKGKEVMRQINEKDPKRANGLLRIDMIERIIKMVEEEYKLYLPF